MRFSQVVSGITAALLVSGVPAAKIPKRQDVPPVSSSVSSSETPAPPASTEAPIPPPPAPPASTETPAPHHLLRRRPRPLPQRIQCQPALARRRRRHLAPRRLPLPHLLPRL
ncbi:hypothetical protein K449DRAFT_38821 [Hypoxylon sp. EC38]|nr:hypothetical protein K449DRAFT_38821 [Hypoxylon sp. EC38]